MDGSKRVKAFFDKQARQFDAYYLDESKPLSWKILDFIFRRSIHARLILTLEECKSPRPVKILDVGCGSGRCAVKLLRQGAATLTGIDFSPEMIKIAKELGQEYRVQDRCHFVLEDFAQAAFNEKFDICVALGFFDYTRDPENYLQKMKELATEKIIASFPAKWRLRNIVRVVRHKILRCPVYSDTRKPCP